LTGSKEVTNLYDKRIDWHDEKIISGSLFGWGKEGGMLLNETNNGELKNAEYRGKRAERKIPKASKMINEL